MVVLGHAAKMHNGSRSAFLQPPKNLFGSARRNAYSEQSVEDLETELGTYTYRAAEDE